MCYLIFAFMLQPLPIQIFILVCIIIGHGFGILPFISFLEMHVNIPESRYMHACMQNTFLLMLFRFPFHDIIIIGMYN